MPPVILAIGGGVAGAAVAGTIGVSTVAAVAGGALIGAAIGSSIESAQQDARRAQQNVAQAQREQQAALEKQYVAEQKKADLQNIQNIRVRVRRERLARAQMVNRGFQLGGAGSSGLAGGISSLASQTASGIGYMQDIAAANTAIGGAQLEAAGAAGRAQVAQAQVQLATSEAQQGATVFGTLASIAFAL